MVSTGPSLGSVPGALLSAWCLWTFCDMSLMIASYVWGCWDSWEDGVSQPGPHSNQEAVGLTLRPRATSSPHSLLFHSSPCSQSLEKLEIGAPPSYIHFTKNILWLLKTETGENYLKISIPDKLFSLTHIWLDHIMCCFLARETNILSTKKCDKYMQFEEEWKESCVIFLLKQQEITEIFVL